MKTNFYFSHDQNAQNDLKIISLISRFGMEGYGTFWVIVELIHSNDGQLDAMSLNGIAIRFNMDYETLREIVNYCDSIKLLTFDKETGIITSNRVNKNIEKMNEISRINKINASKRIKNK